jgi:homoserine dehydrogenase
MSTTLAIVGLGTVGAEFLVEILKHKNKGIEVRCVAELAETAGKELARKAGVEILPLEKLIAGAGQIDAIFDLTGSKSVRRYLRDQLEAAGNKHTVVVPETVSRMMWALMTNQNLPQPKDHDAGY